MFRGFTSSGYFSSGYPNFFHSVHEDDLVAQPQVNGVGMICNRKYSHPELTSKKAVAMFDAVTWPFLKLET